MSTIRAEDLQFTLSLENGLTHQPLPNVLVKAYKQQTQPRLIRVVMAQAETDNQGQVIFNLSALAENATYLFGVNPYIPGRVAEIFSPEMTQSEHFTFRVGTVPINLLDGEQKQPLVGVKILLKKVNDSKYKTIEATTDDQGTVPFDLVELETGATYLAEVVNPFGSAKIYTTPPITQEGPIDFIIYPNGTSFVLNPLQLINRVTFGTTPALLQHVKSVGALIFLGEQLAPETLDNSELEALLKNYKIDSYHKLTFWQLLHIIYSQRQLQEVMTQFWDNHFSTFYLKAGGFSQQAFDNEKAENELFRQQALGHFRDLLGLSAKSPAMLRYLDNTFSQKEAPNENYARELMELHTLGVDGGYTEKDVAEVARIFTGWRVVNNRFRFEPTWHDTGNKVLSKVFNNNGSSEVVIVGRSGADGQQEGEEFLDRLAAHSATAHFICTKLLQRFVNDQPSEALKQACAMVFSETHGDMKQIMTFLLISPEFNAPSEFHRKIKTPLELTASVLRQLQVILPLNEGSVRSLHQSMADMGMLPFGNPVPTGWPEIGSQWMTTAQILQRIRLVNSIIFQTRTDRADVDLKNFFLTQGYETAEPIVDFLLALTLSDDYSPTEREIAVNLLADFDLNASDAEEKLRRLVSTVLSFPTYQLQ